MSTANRHIERIAFWLAVAAIAALLVGASWHHFEIADFSPINGTWQNANSSLRIASGQFPGRDFIAYLGFGPIWLAYPLTKLLGSTYASNGAAMEFLHQSAFLLDAWILGRVSGLTTRNSVLAACGFEAVVRLSQMTKYGMLTGLLLDPSTSALGIRASLPILVFGLLSLRQARIASLRFSVLAGICGGLAPLWSNDFGLPTTVTVAIAVAQFDYRTPIRLLRNLTLYAVVAATTFYIGAQVLTGGNALGWFHDNFIDIKNYQSWTFTNHPEEQAFSFLDIRPDPLVCISFVAAIYLLFSKRSPFGRRALGYAFTAAALAGLLASLGGMPLDRYWSGAMRTAAYVLPAALAQYAQSRPRLADKFSYLTNRFRTHLHISASCSFAIVVGLTLAFPQGHVDEPVVASPELGAPISLAYADMVDAARAIGQEADTAGIPSEKRVFSLYTTAFDTIAGARNPTGEDYVIHRMGASVREKYDALLATGVTEWATTPRDGTIGWMPWVIRQHWDAWRELALHYEPTRDVSYLRLWRRRHTPLKPDGSAVDCRLDHSTDGKTVLEFSSESGLQLPYWAEATVSTIPRPTGGLGTIVGPKRLVALRDIGADDRLPWNMDTEMWFTLPPDGAAARFPVLLIPGQRSKVEIKSFPEGGIAVDHIDCQAALFLPLHETEISNGDPVLVSIDKIGGRPLMERSTQNPKIVALHLIGRELFSHLEPLKRLLSPCLGERTIQLVQWPRVAYIVGGVSKADETCLATQPEMVLTAAF